jgi:hypothetical protein
MSAHSPTPGKSESNALARQDLLEHAVQINDRSHPEAAPPAGTLSLRSGSGAEEAKVHGTAQVRKSKASSCLATSQRRTGKREGEEVKALTGDGGRRERTGGGGGGGRVTRGGGHAGDGIRTRGSARDEEQLRICSSVAIAYCMKEQGFKNNSILIRFFYQTGPAQF